MTKTPVIEVIEALHSDWGAGTRKTMSSCPKGHENPCATAILATVSCLKSVLFDVQDVEKAASWSAGRGWETFPQKRCPLVHLSSWGHTDRISVFTGNGWNGCF